MSLDKFENDFTGKTTLAFGAPQFTDESSAAGGTRRLTSVAERMVSELHELDLSEEALNKPGSKLGIRDINIHNYNKDSGFTYFGPIFKEHNLSGELTEGTVVVLKKLSDAEKEKNRNERLDAPPEATYASPLLKKGKRVLTHLTFRGEFNLKDERTFGEAYFIYSTDETTINDATAQIYLSRVEVAIVKVDSLGNPHATEYQFKFSKADGDNLEMLALEEIAKRIET